jgi:hypothetical protein
MPTLQADDLIDLVKTTQRDLGELKWTEIATDLQEHVALPNLLSTEKVAFDSGYGIQWNLMTEFSGAARDTGLYAVDNVNVQDVMQTAYIPWRHVTSSYAIERREIAMNREPRRIVDLVKVRRADAMLGLAEHMERRFWQAPTAPNDDRLFGCGYWMVYNATKGFNGQNPTGFSDVAGLDSSTSAFSRWRNFTAQYTDVSANDLITKWREAAVKTNFKPLASMNQPSYSGADRYGYYTNYNVLGQLETILTTQNDNLGNDIAPKDGQVVFRRVPVTYVPYLDVATGDPIYGINWSVFQPVFLSGEYMRETGPETASNQHTVMNTFIDCTLNIRCTNRRRLFLLAKSAPTFAS